MIEGGFDQRRQRPPIFTFAARVAPPAVDAFAERGQPIEHDVGEIAIGLEIGAAFIGDGVELFQPSADAVT